ncbi:hypothetical protein GW915_12545 [bacterium]|nr:hypothetical protein [bacterium]
MAHIDTSASGGKGASQDFELNLAPIIDCLVVLIAFLMVSLSYLSIQMLDAGVSSPGGTVQSTSQGVSLNIEIKGNDKLQLTIQQGNKTIEKSFVALADLDGSIIAVLAKTKLTPETALLSADDEIPYEQVITVMDQVRNHVSKVQLSGF